MYRSCFFISQFTNDSMRWSPYVSRLKLGFEIRFMAALLISLLFNNVVNLQAELSYLQAHLTTLELPSPPPPPPPPSQTLVAAPPLSISDLPSASSVPATYDLSSLFDPMVAQTSWAMQQRQIDPRQYGGTGSASSTGSGDLQALARELLHRQGSPHLPCTDASVSPAPSPSRSLSK
ncbi:hypothetical protein GOBAR_AA26681 [Gossypium barbadense]|uniref:LOB domain-containing protein n=1 Tax=Gossypium barbadense TaxID=3634 RepID=A0A2P5WSC3_GOSBA|nr:hypothetical protein GOBAR_AA26681 [Gossypium barbadense]